MQLKDVFQHHSHGLYRDDGLIAVKVLSGPEIDIYSYNYCKHTEVTEVKEVTNKILE